MGPLRELLATDHRQALEFFFQRLKDVSGPTVDHQELLYNASVLAHYAQVSTHADGRAGGSGDTQRGLRPFRGRHEPAARQPDDGNRRRPMPGAGGVLRGSDAPAAQHPLVCAARRRFLQPGGRAGTIPTQGPTARTHRRGLRALAPAPRATEPRSARPAVSADASAAITHLGAGRDHLRLATLGYLTLTLFTMVGRPLSADPRLPVGCRQRQVDHDDQNNARREIPHPRDRQRRGRAWQGAHVAWAASGSAAVGPPVRADGVEGRPDLGRRMIPAAPQ